MVMKLIGRVKLRKCILAICICIPGFNVWKTKSSRMEFCVHKGRHWMKGRFRVTHLYHCKSHPESNMLEMVDVFIDRVPS